MIIDCHGHYTTAPATHEGWRKAQIDAGGDGKAMRDVADPAIGDDEIRESLENTQLRLQRERGTDLTIFSPRAGGMGHHIGTAEMSRQWARRCNDLIKRVCDLNPRNFAPGLPASAVAGGIAHGMHPRTCPLRRGDGPSSAATSIQIPAAATGPIRR